MDCNLAATVSGVREQIYGSRNPVCLKGPIPSILVVHLHHKSCFYPDGAIIQYKYLFRLQDN